MQSRDSGGGLVGRKLWGLVALFGCASGCAAIQGGSEGEEIGKCAYESTPVTDPDAVLDGFDESARSAFAPTAVSLSGSVKGHGVVLDIEPTFSQLVVLYDQNGEAECTPNLTTAGTVHLRVVDEDNRVAEVEGPIGLELRFGVLLGSARLEVNPGDALEAFIPAFEATPIGNPTLQFWLIRIGDEQVDSEWRWSVPIDCTGKDLCSGYDEVSWGKPTLTRM